VSASANRDLLLFHSVKAVVRAVDTSVQTENPFGDDFRYLWVDCLDVDEQDMRQFFENTNKFIGDTIDSGETVFVHCRQGKSRSVTLVTTKRICLLLSEKNPKGGCIFDVFSWSFSRRGSCVL
jgi:protein-tyrosine phosphatase